LVDDDIGSEIYM